MHKKQYPEHLIVIIYHFKHKYTNYISLKIKFYKSKWKYIYFSSTVNKSNGSTWVNPGQRSNSLFFFNLLTSSMTSPSSTSRQVEITGNQVVWPGSWPEFLNTIWSLFLTKLMTFFSSWRWQQFSGDQIPNFRKIKNIQKTKKLTVKVKKKSMFFFCFSTYNLHDF